ncbi:MAG: hypothetical protein WC169_00035 [Dehalococcoidia bacterium]
MGKYEDEIEIEMMNKLAEQERHLSVTNVIEELDKKSRSIEFQKKISQTLHEASTKHRKKRWFDIF